MIRRPPRSPLFPTRRSSDLPSRNSPTPQATIPRTATDAAPVPRKMPAHPQPTPKVKLFRPQISRYRRGVRSEEHTSELQSLTNLVCRLLLEKKKNEFIRR